MKVFLSHSSIDAGLARKLAVDLQAANLDVWLDQWELEVGDEIKQSIENGVEDADFILVLLSSYSVASTWVRHEWQLKVLEEAKTKKISIVPVRCEQCAMPDILAQRSSTDISRGSYPLGFKHLLDILSFYAQTEITTPLENIVDEEQLSRFRFPILMPIELHIASNLISLCGEKTDFFEKLIPQIRYDFLQQYGFPMPGIRVVGDEKGSDLKSNMVMISIEEVCEV